MSIQTGDVGELSFMLKARKLGLVPFFPLSQETPFDIIVANNKNLYRVQVKATNTKDTKKIDEDVYYCSCAMGRSSKVKYDKDAFDFFAFYVVPEDTFYIVPRSAVESVKVRLYVNRNDHRYSKYRERWDLFE